MNRLKTWTRSEGRIRLSEDDGPPSREFLEDDSNEESEGLDDDYDDEPLSERPSKPRSGKRSDNEARPLQPMRISS